MILVGAGIAPGLGTAAAVTRSLALFLFGVSPFHAPTFGLASLFLLAAGLAAAFLPARRAARVDPMSALRNE